MYQISLFILSHITVASISCYVGNGCDDTGCKFETKTEYKKVQCSSSNYSSCLTIYWHSLGSTSRHCGFSAKFLNDPKGPYNDRKILDGHIEMGGLEKKDYFKLGNDCKYIKDSVFLKNITTCRCSADLCNSVPVVDSSIAILFIFGIVLCLLLTLSVVIICVVNCQGCCKIFSVCKCRQKSDDDEE